MAASSKGGKILWRGERQLSSHREDTCHVALGVFRGFGLRRPPGGYPGPARRGFLRTEVDGGTSNWRGLLWGRWELGRGQRLTGLTRTTALGWVVRSAGFFGLMACVAPQPYTGDIGVRIRGRHRDVNKHLSSPGDTENKYPGTSAVWGERREGPHDDKETPGLQALLRPSSYKVRDGDGPPIRDSLTDHVKNLEEVHVGASGSAVRTLVCEEDKWLCVCAIEEEWRNEDTFPQGTSTWGFLSEDVPFPHAKELHNG